MENIKKIADNMKEGIYRTDTAELCAEDRVIVAGEYSYLCYLLGNVLTQKPIDWNRMRPEYKSDTACERAWEQTTLGIQEMQLRLQMKSAENIMRALKDIIRQAENERLHTPK